MMLIVMKILYLSEKADIKNSFITSSDEDAAQDFNKIGKDDDIEM